MASILVTLPNDILLDILDLLPKNDLLNLALVSSRITGPAQRVLYRSIYLVLEPPNKPDQFAVQPGNLRLVNTLSQHPHIRLYVLELSIRVIDHSFSIRFKDYESLLHLVPCLQSLSLDPPSVHFQLSNLSLPFLETLRLDFNNRGERLPTNERKDPIEIIARQFWAPHLRRLHINGISFTSEMSVLFPPDRYRTASITDLEFCSSDEEDVGCLPDILLCVKTLKRFTLEILTPWESSHMSASAMEPRTIGQFLRIHASTLEWLEIAGSDAAEFPSTSLIGSLAGYHNVKRLAIPEPFLVTEEDETSTLVNVLPPNLQELQLQFPMLFIQGKDKYRATRIKRLEQLAAAKLIRFPALRRVIWWSQPAECWDDGIGSRYGPVSDMDHLITTFYKAGVKFEWLSTAYFEDTPFRRKDDENS